MSKLIVKIINVTTGEEIEREMNETEYAQYEANELASKQAKEEEELKVAARQAILDRLGLTEEEARLLLG